jgi:glutamate formiminotransferase/formiminotetrahydrofolate cyclodeaminase
MRSIPAPVQGKAAYQSMEVIKAMVETGNPNSVTGAGVAALCAQTAVLGAFMNVRVNASGYNNRTYIQVILNEGEALQQMAIDRKAEIIEIVNNKIL